MIRIDGAAEGRRMKQLFESVSDQVATESERELERAVLQMENDAKAMAPVDTGRLRNSIGHRKVSHAEWEVGTNVPYAELVEYGTKHTKPQPYLRPAFDKNWSKLRDGMKRAIGRGL